MLFERDNDESSLKSDQELRSSASASVSESEHNRDSGSFKRYSIRDPIHILRLSGFYRRALTSNINDHLEHNSDKHCGSASHCYAISESVTHWSQGNKNSVYLSVGHGLFSGPPAFPTNAGSAKVGDIFVYRNTANADKKTIISQQVWYYAKGRIDDTYKWVLSSDKVPPQHPNHPNLQLWSGGVDKLPRWLAHTTVNRYMKKLSHSISTSLRQVCLHF